MANNRTLPILITTLLLLPLCLTLKSSFTISKSYLSPSQPESPITLGTLSIFEQDSVNQAYIESNEPIFVSSEELKKYRTVVLIFVDERSGKQYRTAVNWREGSEGQHREKIVVVLSSSDQVIGFNYVQAKEVKNSHTDISVELEEPEKGVEHVFKVETQKKQAAVQESFFSKYKWPLIIGGVLLYMTMNANTDKPQAPAAQ